MKKWGGQKAVVPVVPAAEPVVEAEGPAAVVETPKVPWVSNGCPVEPCLKERNHAGEHTQGGVK